MLPGKAGQVWQSLEPVLEGLNYELVDLDFHGGSQGGAVLRVFIDHLPGPDGVRPGKVTLEDCENASRVLGLHLDAEDLIAHAYTLEVSSPGMERRMRKAADFERFLGREVQVDFTEKIQGRRKVRGIICAVRDGEIEVAEGANPPLSFTPSLIKRAHLIVDFDQVFQDLKLT